MENSLAGMERREASSLFLSRFPTPRSNSIIKPWASASFCEHIPGAYCRFLRFRVSILLNKRTKGEHRSSMGQTTMEVAKNIENMVSMIEKSPQEEADPVVARQFAAAAADHRPLLSRVTSRIRSITQMGMGMGECFTTMLAGHRAEDDRLGAVGDIEQGILSQIEVINEADRSTSTDLRLKQCALRSDGTLTVALALVGASFAAMYNVPGGFNDVGKAVMDDTIPFVVFLVADILTFHASILTVAMIVARNSHMSTKVVNKFIRIVLWAATVCLALTFHASAYVVALPRQEWIVLCFGALAIIELPLLLLLAISAVYS